jgi:hypothetical protein
MWADAAMTVGRHIAIPAVNSNSIGVIVFDDPLIHDYWTGDIPTE